MSVKMRQLVEREIVMATVDALLAAGFNISVFDDLGGGEPVLRTSKDRSKIEQVLFQTDENCLIVKNKERGLSGCWVQFVYGNDGYDVMHDYHTELEPFIGARWTYPQIIASKYGD